MQFLNPLFLIGLSAIAIPIAIHFFNLRRYKKVYFSDISKLEELAEETKRQSRLKHLLILAARIFAIAFLAIAFAQPVIPPKESALPSGDRPIHSPAGQGLPGGNRPQPHPRAAKPHH